MLRQYHDLVDECPPCAGHLDVQLDFIYTYYSGMEKRRGEMTTISAEGYEIVVRDGFWQLIPVDEHSVTTLPVFQVTRGGGIMEYTPGFGESHHLPGTVLSIEYVRAVVIGYEDKSRRWLLGFHIARDPDEKPRWLQIVRWPAGDNLQYAPAARFSSSGRSGVTGPLLPHEREDIGPKQVKLLAHEITLPIQHPNMWLGRARTGVTLRLAKEAITKQGGIAPSFNQCIIDPEQGSIRLLPPTGLLGAFFSGQQGRVLDVGDVRNVELRHTTRHEFVTQEESRDIATEVTYITYLWDIYLTLPDESLLLAQTSHTTSSELSRQRATSSNKFAVDTQAGIEYLRQHQADQEAKDAAEKWAESAAIVIASTLDVHLVKTAVEERNL
jgi:hypothetical protein